MACQWVAGACSGNGAARPTEDWICAVALASPDVLYVGTRLGALQRVTLPRAASPGTAGREEEWEQVSQNGRAEALSCLAVSPFPL